MLTVLGRLLFLPFAVLSPLQVGTTPWLLNELLTRVLSAVLSTFSIVVITDAYLQVRGGTAEAETE